ncbi:conjugal transfer protein [Streptomyces sp. NPDC002886]|uniref:conjugal transfer protein n=1 Tax=Streptomyces sp. NPDC002886 TaxID=3364667 RepID=UPI00368ECC9A
MALRQARPETVPGCRPVSRGPRFAWIGIWTALAAGPLALAVALASPETTVAQAAPTARVSDGVRPPAEPGGVAEMFVELWLRSDAAAPDSSVAAALRALAPQTELPKRPGSEAGTPASTGRAVAVRTLRGPGGGWTVVVAALGGRDQAVPAAPGSPVAEAPLVRYFAVSGTSGRDGGSVTISGSPAEVAAPDVVAVAESGFSHRVPSSGALASSLGEFVRAYLGGQGTGLERYLSPGLEVSAPKAAPYVRVDIEDVTANAESAVGAAVPADGARARVRVRVIGEDRAGVRWPLAYRLEVIARAGRWEVSALEAGVTAPLTGSASSSPAATAGGAR